MRSLDTNLAAHLAGATTTLAHCWRLTRRDGAVEGFTDHDRDLVFDGTAFLAASGLEGSEGLLDGGRETVSHCVGVVCGESSVMWNGESERRRDVETGEMTR